MSVQEGVKEYLASRGPSAIVISGPWGRGKTWFWNDLITRKQQERDGSVRKYSYVSMFGLSTLDDVKSAIFHAATTWDFEQRGWYQKAIDPRWWWFAIKRAGSWCAGTFSVSYIGNLSRAYSSLAFASVRDRLICLDDIERRGGDLRLLDVMGLVSSLKEQKGCKIVVILNENALSEDDAKVWRANAEKVFLRELRYQPEAGDCVELVFRDTMTDRLEFWCSRHLVELGISNIRIIERVRYFADWIRETVKGVRIREATHQRLAKALVMLVYARTGEGEGAPSFDYFCGRRMADLVFLSKEKDTRTPEQMSWDGLLSSYGFFLDDELDEVLRLLVANGYGDAERLRMAVQATNLSDEEQRRYDAYFAAWETYHGTLSDNREEVVEQFRTTFFAAVNQISVNNLDATVGLLREIGEASLADEMIEAWVKAHEENAIAVFDPRVIHQLGRLRDSALVQRVQQAYEEKRRLPEVEDALSHIGEHSSWNPEHIQAIAYADNDDLVQVLRGKDPGHLLRGVKACLDLSGGLSGAPYEKASHNLKRALAQIAKESELCYIRIKHKFPGVVD